MHKPFMLMLLTFCAMCALPPAKVTATVIPPNLLPGSQYQLVFFTTNYFSATSSDIDDYNAFVTSEAALNPALPQGVTWRAIGSTATVQAHVNAPAQAGIPIYNTHGQVVVSDAQDLYANVSLTNPINYDQFGTFSTFRYIFTGSTPLGERFDPYYLGSPDGSSIIGYNSNTNFQWIDSNGAITQTYGFASLYALSDPITVPVPEPSSAVIFGAAILGLLGWRCRRKCWNK